jgi:hypothetical protein
LSLHERIESLARDLAKREARYGDDLERARDKAAALHREVSTAIDRFNEVLGAVVPNFDVVVSEPRIDDKHLHAVEFDLERGRHRAIVTLKSKGEVTFVGPFRAGKAEGPCRSFAFPADAAAEAELQDALGDFLERFLEEAATP